MTTRVHRVEVLIVDTDGVGADGVRGLLEHTKYPNWAIRPHVMSVETREVEWSDEHPLNYAATQESAYRELFGAPDQAEALAAADALAERCLQWFGGDDKRCLACNTVSPGGRAHTPWTMATGERIDCPLEGYRAARGAR